MTPETELDARKIKLVELVLQGKKRTEIANIIGVSRRTVYTWLDDPNVQKLYEEEKKDVIDAGKNYLISHYIQFIKKLVELALTSEDARTQLSAIQSGIERVAGKVPTTIETNEKPKDNVTDDMLDQAIKDVDDVDDEDKPSKEE